MAAAATKDKPAKAKDAEDQAAKDQDRAAKARAKEKAAKEKDKAAKAKEKEKAAKAKDKERAAKAKEKEKAAKAKEKEKAAEAKEKERAAKAKEKEREAKAKEKEKAVKAKEKERAAKEKDKAAKAKDKERAAEDERTKAKKDRAKQDRAKQDRANQDRAKQDRAAQQDRAADRTPERPVADERADETVPGEADVPATTDTTTAAAAGSAGAPVQAVEEVAVPERGETTEVPDEARQPALPSELGSLPDNDKTVRPRGYVAEVLGKEDVVGRSTQRATVAASYTTRDHDVIRAWVQSRSGRPADVAGTGNSGAGVLRIEFPDGPGDDSRLEDIDWSAFFATFDDSDVDFLYQERVRTGDISRFHKFVRAAD